MYKIKVSFVMLVMVFLAGAFIFFTGPGSDLDFWQLDSNYADIPSDFKDLMVGALTMTTEITNKPTDEISFDRSDKRFETWTGAAWNPLGFREIRAGSSAGLSLFDDAGELGLHVEDGGQVGIGTATPANNLDVNGNSIMARAADQNGVGAATIFDEGTENYVAFYKRGTNATGNLNSGNGAGELINVGGNLAINTYSAGTHIEFGAGNNEKMRITSDGLVGIGTAAPSYQLELSTDSAAKPSTNTWTVPSDERIKKNIHTMENALDTVCKLRGVTFEYNDVKYPNIKGLQRGMIAQEVKEVIPEWVKEGADGYYSLSIGGFEGLASEAFKEMRAIIDKQQAEIEQLTKAVAALAK